MQPSFPSRIDHLSLAAGPKLVILRLCAVTALAWLCAACGARVCTTSPAVVSAAPAMIAAGGSNFSMTVNGSGFTPAMQVLVNGAERQFQFVNSGQVTLLITSGDIATSGTLRIVVQSRNTNGLFLCGGLANSIVVTIN